MMLILTLIDAYATELSEKEVAALDVEGRTVRHRQYWAEEFGDCYDGLASSVGLGPMALAMV